MLNRSESRRTAAIVATVLLTIAPVSAHDMWIEPATFLPKAGDIVSLRLRVGENLLGDPLARDSRLIRDFVVQDEDGRRPVVGRDGSDPAGLVRAASPGLQVVAYHSTPSFVDLTATKFNQYLAEEGLDTIAARRASEGKTDAGARDAFIRCAKSLLLTGAPNSVHRDVVMGLPLELIAERSPYALGADGTLPVRLLHEGRPLGNVLVVAMNRRNPAEKQRARTDKDGRVRLQIRSGGTWLVKAVHMVPAVAGSGSDWTSYWASLTFGLETTPAVTGNPSTARTH